MGICSGKSIMDDESAETTPTWVIYPWSPRDPNQARSISKLLLDLVGDERKVQLCQSKYGNWNWTAPLTEEQARRVEAYQGVCMCDVFVSAYR